MEDGVAAQQQKKRQSPQLILTGATRVLTVNLPFTCNVFPLGLLLMSVWLMSR